jgi:hypothetical protein
MWSIGSRVVLDLVDLFLGAVLGRVRHRVAAIAIGLHLEDVGTFAAAGVLGGAGAGFTHRDDVHAVDFLARDPERDAALVEGGFGRRALDAGAHGVLVVLDHVHDRQLPELGHVEALVDLALVGRAVAHIGVADVAIALVAVGQRQAGAERYLGADDAVAAVEAGLDVEHVHRAALAARRTARAAGQLGHHFAGSMPAASMWPWSR